MPSTIRLRPRSCRGLSPVGSYANPMRWQTTVELSGFVGPLLAGALIAVASGTHATALVPDGAAAAPPSTTGVGLAFAVVAVAFFVAALLLAGMRLERRDPSGGRPTGGAG